MSDSAAPADQANPTTPNEAAAPDQATEMSLRVLLGFLRAGRVLDHGSSVLLLGGLVAGLLQSGGTGELVLGSALVLGALVLGALAKYLAWRVALDAEFFALLLEQPGHEAAFDQALAAFLGRPAPAATRTLASRWQGARRLVRRQAAVVAMQALLLVAAWAVFSRA